ncbi:MAG: helix-turn-helix transcriptional regulator [Thermosipho sp. (in: Bacteria)]|nr:helix-turn-helix transcriptional regulator [Thermosipho sp. (in: thermotogales)]
MTKIKEIRIQKGLTQETLARQAGITLRHYQRIENNQHTPNVKLALKIAKILNVPVENLFNEI